MGAAIRGLGKPQRIPHKTSIFRNIEFRSDIPIHHPSYFLNSPLVIIDQSPQANYAFQLQLLIIVVLNCCHLLSKHPFYSAHYLCNKQTTARVTIPPLPPTLVFCSLSLRYSNDRTSNYSTLATLPHHLGRGPRLLFGWKSWIPHHIRVCLLHNQVIA